MYTPNKSKTCYLKFSQLQSYVYLVEDCLMNEQSKKFMVNISRYLHCVFLNFSHLMDLFLCLDIFVEMLLQMYILVELM